MKPAPILAILLVLAALCPAAASGAGGPILITAGDGERGITSADDEFNYAVLSGSETTVAKIATGTGEVDAWMNRSEGLPFGIPRVAADGGVAGLSADGGTLVLIGQAGPINRTELLVFGTNKLTVLDRITLDGQYSFDAISPDGRTAYVVEYPRPFRYDRYRVMRLDLRTGKLARRPIADADVGLTEEGESGGGKASVAGEMRGMALSRVASPDGRWAYTLYDGGGDIPFIHALDTVGDRAVCVFMPGLEGLAEREVRRMRLAAGADDGSILVTDRDGAGLATVDTASFAVTAPAEDAFDPGSTVPETLAIAIVAVLAVAGAAVAVSALRRRRTRKIAPGPKV